ncbi:hypothetical protein SSX86_024937 [Deinandra increscens subsp. villosa]|uniref:Uncharacterized protein n=1 Tax=Deinandra increscens subsp. villosa TaxID=3103831 RepID=A0AAP0GMH6_9ASTR
MILSQLHRNLMYLAVLLTLNLSHQQLYYYDLSVSSRWDDAAGMCSLRVVATTSTPDVTTGTHCSRFIADVQPTIATIYVVVKLCWGDAREKSVETIIVLKLDSLVMGRKGLNDIKKRSRLHRFQQKVCIVYGLPSTSGMIVLVLQLKLQAPIKCQ